MREYIDLHVHTSKSDGFYPLEWILKEAEKIGLSAIAVTDHDTIEALTDIKNLSIKSKVAVIPGVELTAYNRYGSEIHILGYGIDIYSDELQQKLKKIQANRFCESMQIIHILSKSNVPLPIDEFVQNGYQVNGFGVKQLLAQKGYLDDAIQAFPDLFQPDGKLKVPKRRLSTEDAIRLIKNSGGKAYLAHALSVSKDIAVIEVLVKQLISEGLDGIECYNSIFKQNPYPPLCDLAEKYHLHICGGSDFHGKVKPDVALGRGKGDIRVAYAVLAKMKVAPLI